MTERDVIVRCPGCGNGKVISMAVGQLLQCDVCRTAFHAPIAADDEVDPTTLTDSFVVEQPAVPDKPSSDSRLASRGGAASDSGSQITGSGSRIKGTRSWRPHELEVAPMQDAGATAEGPAASTSSSASDSDLELDIREASGLFWTFVAMFAVGVILTTAVVAVFFVVRAFPDIGRGRPAAENAQSDVQSSVAVRWTDASTSSQRRDPMTLKVERVIYGAIRARDLANQVITTEDDNLLGITISANNRGRRSRAFQNWYGHAFETVNGDEIVAELTDDQDRSYSLLKFDDVSHIEGQRLAEQIDPRQTVQDTVVFLIPEDVDRSAVRYFRLALPGAAVGLSDFFRFQIPSSMIEGFNESPVEEQWEGDEAP